MQNTIIKRYENHPGVLATLFQQGGSNGETQSWVEIFWENYFLRTFVMWDPSGNAGQAYGMPQTGLPFGRTFVIDQQGIVSLPLFGYDADAVIDAIDALLGEEPGTGYCFGDPGSGTPCPCSNDNDGSVPGSGCANGVFASGARLTGSGVASVSADTLVLTASGMEPDNWGLYFQADNDLSPGVPWGDGLRCAGGALRRLEPRLADGSGVSQTTVTISTKAGNVTAGSVKRYQCWYRNPLAPPCGPGVNDFNATGGYEVVWGP